MAPRSPAGRRKPGGAARRGGCGRALRARGYSRQPPVRDVMKLSCRRNLFAAGRGAANPVIPLLPGGAAVRGAAVVAAFEHVVLLVVDDDLRGALVAGL